MLATTSFLAINSNHSYLERRLIMRKWKNCFWCGSDLKNNHIQRPAIGDSYCNESCLWDAITEHGLLKWNALVKKVINA